MKFYCLKCGSKLSADSELYGEEIKCPNCAQTITVPYPEGESAPANKIWEEDEDIPTLRPPRGRAESENPKVDATNNGQGSGKRHPISQDARQEEKEESNCADERMERSYGSRNSTERGRGSRSGPGLIAIIIFLSLIGGIWIYFATSKRNPEKTVPKESANVKPEKTSDIRPVTTDIPKKEDVIQSEKKPTSEVEKKGKAEDWSDFKIVEEKEIENSDCGVRKVIFGEFTVRADLNLNKTVKVHFSIPLGEDGKPVKNASNVVYHCPYMPERNFFKHEYHRWYSEVAGYTFFTMDIVSRLKDIYDRDKIYYYPESGFHDLVFKVKKMIEDYYGLEDRNILLTGHSSGAVMAKEFVLKYYNKVDAAAYLGGHQNIALNSKAKARTACLVMFTCGDEYEAALRYIPDQIQVLRATTAPIWKNKGGRYFHHTASPQAWELIHQFIKGVVELRENNGGKVPYFRDWPYSFKRPNGKTVYFPSKEVKKLWCELPQDAIDELDASYRLYDMSDENLKFHHLERKLIKHPIYFTPKNVKPSAVVIYIHDPKEDHKDKKVTQMDCLYYFMRHGVVGCSVKIDKDHKESYKRIVKLLREVKRRKEWKRLPIYVTGLGIGGELAAIAALRYGDDIEKQKIPIKKGKVTFVKTKIIRHERVKKIVTINSDFSEIKSLNVLTKARGESKIPLIMLYSSKFAGLKPGNKPDYAEVKDTGAKGYTLDKKWFEVLGKIAKGEKL